MTKEYEKFVKSYLNDNLITEEEFNKVISLFPNVEIDWDIIFENITESWDLIEPECFIREIISQLTGYKVWCIDYYEDDNSIDLELPNNLTNEEFSECVDKLTSLNFIVNDLEDLQKDVENNFQYKERSHIKKKIYDLINGFSLTELETLYKNLND